MQGIERIKRKGKNLKQIRKLITKAEKGFKELKKKNGIPSDPTKNYHREITKYICQNILEFHHEKLQRFLSTLVAEEAHNI